MASGSRAARVRGLSQQFGWGSLGQPRSPVSRTAFDRVVADRPETPVAFARMRQKETAVGRDRELRCAEATTSEGSGLLALPLASVSLRSHIRNRSWSQARRAPPYSLDLYRRSAWRGPCVGPDHGWIFVARDRNRVFRFDG